LRVPSKKALQFCSSPQALPIWPSSKRVSCILWFFNIFQWHFVIWCDMRFPHNFLRVSTRRWTICRPSSCRFCCRMRTERTTAKHAAHNVCKKAVLACLVMIAVAAKSHSSESLLISSPYVGWGVGTSHFDRRQHITKAVVLKVWCIVFSIRFLVRQWWVVLRVRSLER
jgi:hypothetical protein